MAGTEVEWGGPPEPLSTEPEGLALLTEEYPEVVMSLASTVLLWLAGSGPGDRRSVLLEQSSSSLDSWQQCCSGFRYTTVTSKTPLGAVTARTVEHTGTSHTAAREALGRYPPLPCHSLLGAY